jgi:hypothetical protein
MDSQQIVGDVWLYNCCPAPKEPEWRSAELVPFANPVDYVAQEGFAPPSSVDDIEVRWSRSSPGEIVTAWVFIRGKLHATLAAGEKLGRCRLAAKDGPLARVFPEADDHRACRPSSDAPEC